MTTPTEDPRRRLARAARRHQTIKAIRQEMEEAIVYALTDGVSPTEVAEIVAPAIKERRIRQIARAHGIEPADAGPKRSSRPRHETAPESTDGP